MPGITTGSKINSYEVISGPIGKKSSYGSIYIVSLNGNNVALKLLNNLGDTEQERFKLENKILNELKPHDNIINVFTEIENCSDFHNPFYSMELANHDLDTHLFDFPNLTILERLELLEDVVKGIKHAHERGYIHRDLKDENVLIKINSNIAICKLSDFGTAKDLNSSLTLSSSDTFWGAEAIMPPEAKFGLSNALNIFKLGDIYSVGILAYTILVNRPYKYIGDLLGNLNIFFRTKRILDTTQLTVPQRRTLFDEWLNIHGQNFNNSLQVTFSDSDLTEKLNNFISNCVNLDYSRRFQSMTDAHIDLSNIIQYVK
jgi:serine/threonine protein kinase